MNITRDQARDFADAHAEGLHDEIPREGCPECDGKDLSRYPVGCGHINIGGDGIARSCDQPKGHKGWHGKTVRLRNSSGGGSYASTTNWGDDGKGIHASRGRTYDNGRTWVLS